MTSSSVGPRRAFLIAAAALAAPLAAFAQQKVKVWRIGFLGSTTASGFATQVEALRAGLRDLGYVEGKNIVIEYRWAEENFARLPELAAELVRLKVDVIVTHAAPGTRAAKQATTTIPIVMAASADAVATGLVASLARPGGNVTGSTQFSPEITAKRLELLREATPRITQVALLLRLDNPANEPVLPAMELAAKSLKIVLRQFAVRGPKEFEGAFSAMAKTRVEAVVISDDPMLIANARMLAEAAARRRLPSAGNKPFAEAGGLIGYGVNPLDQWRHAAVFVDKILKGAKPGDLPVERAIKFELVLNRKTAKTLGINIPASILARASEMIE